MHPLSITFKLIARTFAIIVLLTGITLLSACGGGGGGGSSSTPDDTNITPVTPTTPTDNFMPDENLLDSPAETSSELYVEPDFQFDNYRNLHVYFNATNFEHAPIANRIIKVYAVAEDTESWDELRAEDKSMLFVGRTDINGLMERDVEVAATTRKVLVVIDSLGMENKVLISVNGDTLSHHFHQDSP